MAGGVRGREGGACMAEEHAWLRGMCGRRGACVAGWMAAGADGTHPTLNFNQINK